MWDLANALGAARRPASPHDCRTAVAAPRAARARQTVAIVGASANPLRPSYTVFSYLRTQTPYDVTPINPSISDDRRRHSLSVAGGVRRAARTRRTWSTSSASRANCVAGRRRSDRRRRESDLVSIRRRQRGSHRARRRRRARRRGRPLHQSRIRPLSRRPRDQRTQQRPDYVAPAPLMRAVRRVCDRVARSRRRDPRGDRRVACAAADR